MDLFGDWIATANGVLDTQLAMAEPSAIAYGWTRVELVKAASLIGILLNILMHGLRPKARE